MVVSNLKRCGLSLMILIFLVNGSCERLDISLNQEWKQVETPQDQPVLEKKSTLKVSRNVPAPAGMSSEFLAKVTKLYKLLSVCDKENFKLEEANVPDSVPIHKYMMALSKLADAKVIKKTPRYERIMENCGQLVDTKQAKLEKTLSVESQMSGITYDYSLQNLDISPFQNLRDRVISTTSRVTAGLESVKKSWKKPPLAASPSSNSPITNGTFVIEYREPLEKPTGSFITFF